MTFEKIDSTSFQLSFDDGSTQIYRLKEGKFTLWQLKQMGVLFEEFMTRCSKNGSVLMSAVMVAVQSQTKMDLSFLLDMTKTMTGTYLGDTAMAGMGEVVGFLMKEDRIEKLAAILFLKPNEKKLSDAEFRERVELFRDEIDPTFIVQGVQHFFGPKLASWKSTLTRLTASSTQQTQTSANTTQTSEVSTTTSKSTTDTSTPSPTDIPSEKTTS